MLSLSPPYFDFDGMIVARDYTDPTQFWYYPNRPHFALNEGRPAVRFLVYKEDLDEIEGDDEAMAGFMFFDTSLEWPTGKVEAALQKLGQELDLDTDQEPRLSPLLYRSGSVRLIFLDRKSPGPDEDPPDADDPPEEWVPVIESSGIPSLYGENRAVFSVMLTKKAAKLLYASFDGLIPAGVVYDLAYVGMQRAFQIKVEAKWDEVYTFLREYTEGRFLFWSDESEKIVETLEQKKAVTFTSTIEGVGEEGMPGEYADARKLLSQFVFEKFFAPLPNPKDAGDNVGNDILGFLGALRQGGLPFASTSRREELTVTRDLSLELDWTVSKAVERKIAPQATLSLFWEDFPDLTRDDVITVVSGEDDLWRIAELGFVANADFSEHGVATITIDVAYGEMVADEPVPSAKRWSAVLTKDDQKAAIREWYDPDHGTTFHYRYHVAFGPDAVVGDGVVLTSPWLESTGATVTISPEELYTEHRVTFQRSKLLDPTIFPEVLAHIRYHDPATGWSYAESSVLDADGSSWTPVFRSMADAPRELEYRLDYNRSGGMIETAWLPTARTTVLIDDPRPNLFRVNLAFAVAREEFERAAVDFRYEDAEQGIFETGRVVVTKETLDDDHGWAFFRAVPARTRYSYSALLISTGGDVVLTGWVQSDQPTLLLSEALARRWPVRVEIAGPSFAAQGLASVVVDLEYNDSANEYASEKQLTFSGPGLSEPWLLDLRDLQNRSYTYTVRYRLTSGFDRKLGPATADSTFLVLPSTPPIS